MRVMMITPEATPFAQTGGLGEVLSALPLELADLGVEVDVVMPKYKGLAPDAFDIVETGWNIELTLNAKLVTANIWKLDVRKGLRYLFVQHDDYYDRDYLYGTPDGDYPDNAERFVFLARAAMEIVVAGHGTYDVFHSHDWQAALAPVYLRTLYSWERKLEKSAAVLTIHNLGYQGIFWHWDMPLVGVGWEFFTPKHMEFYGNLNFLKSGIVFAEKVNTVSPGYKKEILTPEFGFGLEGVLQEKGEHLSGILNGVDYKVWNPETDQLIARQYSADDLSGKALCKAELQRIAGMPVREDVPVVGMVSRLSSQKGIDLLEGAFSSLVEKDIQLILLGTGEARFKRSFMALRDRYPQQTGIFLAYDYQLAHRIFAGSDMVLVPSRYEPCGLNQLYALKYGAVPVVRSTGGLSDTVEEFDAEKDTGTGFRFWERDSAALERTILKAVDVYLHHPETWKRLMKRGMNKDFSWNRSAREYLKLYEEAIQQRKKNLPLP